MFPDIELHIPENNQNARAMTGLFGIFLILMYQQQIKKRLIEEVLKYAHVLRTFDIMEGFVRDALRPVGISQNLKLCHSQIAFVSLMRKQDSNQIIVSTSEYMLNASLVHEESWWSLETGTDREDKGECGQEGGRCYKETQTCG